MNDPSSATDILDDLEPDPIFLDGLREGGWILMLWVACFAWTMFSCLTNGYPQEVDPANFPTVLGMPAWVAWGIALPWLIANAITVYFCFGYMRDGDLESGNSTSGLPLGHESDASPTKNSRVEGSGHV